MKVLVTAASRHGSTDEIATALIRVLADAGFEVDSRAPQEVTSVADYDAVVIGSAVYVGKWLEPAKQLIERMAAELRQRPVWLFSSGPLGDPPKPEADPTDIPDLVAAANARGHKVFAGRLERDQLGLGERTVVKLVGAPYGDFRDWDVVRAWAAGIVAAINEVAVPAGAR